MKRFVRLRLTGATVISLAALAPTPPPASALTICVGHATVELSTGLGLPVVTSNTASISLDSGELCASGTISSGGWTGTITGACGMATGSGTTAFGAHFTFLVTGATIVFTGEVYGGGIMIEDPVDLRSCTNKTATRFVLTNAYLAV